MERWANGTPLDDISDCLIQAPCGQLLDNHLVRN